MTLGGVPIKSEDIAVLYVSDKLTTVLSFPTPALAPGSAELRVYPTKAPFGNKAVSYPFAAVDPTSISAVPPLPSSGPFTPQAAAANMALNVANYPTAYAVTASLSFTTSNASLNVTVVVVSVTVGANGVATVLFKPPSSPAPAQVRACVRARICVCIYTNIQIKICIHPHTNMW
jgi:hypothetical protein